MDFWAPLFDLLVLLAGATILGALFERLRQNAILGYLLAGTILGPNVLKAIDDQGTVEALAELGVALLLFTIGLEFSWRRLRRMGKVAIGGGTAQILLTLFLVGCGAVALGTGVDAAIVIGAAAALSSTAIVLRVLASRAELESTHGRLAIGILLLQDIAVVPLVLLVELIRGDGSFAGAAWSVGRMTLIAAGLVFVLFLLLNYGAPYLLGSSVMHRNRDLPILTATVIGIGSAWAAHAAGLSHALGAFVAGMLLAETPFATQIRADMAALRTLLITLFFASVGMIGDPKWIAAHAAQVLALVAVIIIVKTVVIWLVLRMFRQSLRQAAVTALSLAQIGEFSFVLATLARDSILTDDQFRLLVSVTIATLLLTPYLILLAPRVGAILARYDRPRPSERAEELEDDEAAPRRADVIIIGFGPAGRMVAETLHDAGISFRVLDLNARSVREAKECGFDALVGDASQADVIEHARIGQADVVVITVPDPPTARSVVHQVRRAAPAARIIARARYHLFISTLHEAGAEVIIDEEIHVGRRLASETRHVLRETAKV